MKKMIVIYGAQTEAMRVCKNLLAHHFGASVILENWSPRMPIPPCLDNEVVLVLTDLDYPIPEAIHFKDAMEQISDKLGHPSTPIPCKKVVHVPFSNPCAFECEEVSPQLFWE